MSKKWLPCFSGSHSTIRRVFGTWVIVIIILLVRCLLFWVIWTIFELWKTSLLFFRMMGFLVVGMMRFLVLRMMRFLILWMVRNFIVRMMGTVTGFRWMFFIIKLLMNIDRRFIMLLILITFTLLFTWATAHYNCEHTAAEEYKQNYDNHWYCFCWFQFCEFTNFKRMRSAHVHI